MLRVGTFGNFIAAAIVIVSFLVTTRDARA
jgi:hypothetical protein